MIAAGPALSRTVAHMPSTDLERAALRCLYGAVSAQVRDDADGQQLLVEQGVRIVGFALMLEAGALSVAEQLRDVAEIRRMPGIGLLRVLIDAHTELTGWPDMTTLMLRGAHAYLSGSASLWTADDLCAFATSPTDALDAAVSTLTSALQWRARDHGVAVADLLSHVCLGLAARDAVVA